METLEFVVGEIDIFTSVNGNYDTITIECLKKMKINAIIENIGHSDNEIDMAGLESFQGIAVEPTRSAVHALNSCYCPSQSHAHATMRPSAMADAHSRGHAWRSGLVRQSAG